MSRISKTLKIATVMMIMVIASSTGKVDAARSLVTTSSSPTSFRTLCDGGTPVDFAVSPSNISMDAATGIMSYDININWQRCSGGVDTRAYAVYSLGPEICPYSGIYGPPPTGWVTDCVKYIGSPAYSVPGNSLSCWGGSNASCVTSSFAGARRTENQPTSVVNSVSIPMTWQIPNWASQPDTGSWSISQSMCQFYKTGFNFGTYNDNRCVNVSISVSWDGSDPVPVESQYTPTAATILNDDEDPTLATLNTRASLDFGPGHSAQIRSEYYIVRNGTSSKEYIDPSNFDAPGISSNPINTNITSGWGSGNLTISNPVAKLSLQVGDKVCSSASIDPSKVSTTKGVVTVLQGQVSSDPSCRSYVNRPFVSFYGTDVSVGGSFEGGGSCNQPSSISTFTKSGAKGSGVQFAAFALGSINNFNSARLRTSSPVSPVGLSFANTVTPAGSFGAEHCITNYFSLASALTPNTTNTNINLSTIDSGNYYYKNPSTITISGDIPNGRRITIFVDGNVRVDGDINYASDTWSDRSQIPFLRVVTKGDIFIESNVQKITGFLVAQPHGATGGNITTCVEPGNNTVLSVDKLANKCNKKLTIDGAFAAKKVNLLRAYKSLRDASYSGELNANSSAAAEVFKFSPIHYLALPGQLIGDLDGPSSDYDYFAALPPIL